MSRRKRFRYWAPIGAPNVAGGVVSVKISVAAGGEVKSLVLIVHLPPTWHAVQPAWVNSARPCLTSLAGRRLPTPLRVNGARGVRTASLTHSLSAVRAGTCRLLPGSVTVCCGRPAFAFAKAFTTHGARLMSPLSPNSSPWFGSSVLVAGGGRAAGERRGQRPGAGDVADVGLEVLDLVEDRRVVRGPAARSCCAG